MKKTGGSSDRVIRNILGLILAFAALNALGGGYYGMAGAESVPLEWLNGSPFKNYFIPGIILFIIVGGSFLIASVSVFANARYARMASFFSVLVVFIWLAVQVSIIGFISWMQPVTASVAFVILILTWVLPERRNVRI